MPSPLYRPDDVEDHVVVKPHYRPDVPSSGAPDFELDEVPSEMLTSSMPVQIPHDFPHESPLKHAATSVPTDATRIATPLVIPERSPEQFRRLMQEVFSDMLHRLDSEFVRSCSADKKSEISFMSNEGDAKTSMNSTDRPLVMFERISEKTRGQVYIDDQPLLTRDQRNNSLDSGIQAGACKSSVVSHKSAANSSLPPSLVRPSLRSKKSAGFVPAESAPSLPRVSVNTAMTAQSTRSQSHFALSQSRKVVVQEAPESAFVINVRRIILVHQWLSLLHELIKSTAIAALTLVSAASRRQFGATVIFIASVFILYAMHEHEWDRLDVEDLKMLLPLICDDEDKQYQGENPNRLFKAVTVALSRVKKALIRFFHVLLAAVAVVAWFVVDSYWRQVADEADTGMFSTDVVEFFMQDEEDALALAMQLTVVCLMHLLELVFVYIHWRETTAIMPLTSSGEIWDPRTDGTPLRYWLFGLPSVWFTSRESYEKLKMYIDLAHPGSRVVNIYPQELAYYALSGEEERTLLQNTLSDAKLFDAKQQSFIYSDKMRTKPFELQIDLCYFDHELNHKDLPYCGEFLYFKLDGEEDEDDVGETPNGYRGDKSTRSSRMVMTRDRTESSRKMSKKNPLRGLTSFFMNRKEDDKSKRWWPKSPLGKQ